MKRKCLNCICVFLLFAFGCQANNYDYSGNNKAEILQKENIKCEFYMEYSCGTDTFSQDTIVRKKVIKEYDKKGQCIKERKWFGNTYTICYYENNKPSLKIEYRLNNMERRDSTVYSYTGDIQNITSNRLRRYVSNRGA